MTTGDARDNPPIRPSPTDSPLRRARARAGLSQTAAIYRFQQAVTELGEHAPSFASLRRMFAYWESGERAVTVATYQQAFVTIYQSPPEALGFAPADESGRIEELREAGFELYKVDAGLVALFESQTQSLRMLDRRLGTAGLIQQAEAHVAQMQLVLRHSVGGARAGLASALAAAAALAGWQALDRGLIRRAWELHDVARSAAREAENKMLLAHVTSQSAYVLLDAHQDKPALELRQSARRDFGSAGPRLLTAWLTAAEADALAAVGKADEVKRRLDAAESLLGRSDEAVELPYLMLNEHHLARWRGHCLAQLGEPEAIDYLTAALAAAGDSVRAATGLHVDLALAHRRAGRTAEAEHQIRVATDMANRFGSTRQRHRLRTLLPAG